MREAVGEITPPSDVMPDCKHHELKSLTDPDTAESSLRRRSGSRSAGTRCGLGSFGRTESELRRPRMGSEALTKLKDKHPELIFASAGRLGVGENIQTGLRKNSFGPQDGFHDELRVLNLV